MSGRGLGHTGGTVDKLESFPGYRTALSSGEFLAQVERIGIAVVGQSGDLAPADKKLYALRDVTATVNSIPLIASSIMSKKIAAGTKNIVLDVKVGSGAFMKSPGEARALAEEMAALGKACGRRVSAVLSDMDRPLGYAVGNILEVKEAVEVLKGRDVPDLREVCITLSARLFALALGLEEGAARRKAAEILDSGRAYGKFLEWITAQGGDAILAEHPERFPEAAYKREVRAEETAYITRMNAEEIGRSAVLLGAGRATKEDTIDLTAGIILRKKTGDRVEKGEVLATLYAASEEKLDSGEKTLREALAFGAMPSGDEPLILGVI